MPTILKCLVLAATSAGLLGDDRTPADDTAQLAPPVIVTVDGQPIDVDVGHAAPLLADCDGDGVRELLVGQFGGGTLRMYPDVAEDGAAPEFEDFFWVESDQGKLSVPGG